MFRRKIHNKKGFTLVEIIVASAVSSILLLGILSIIIPTIETVRFNKNLAHAKNTSSQLIQLVSNKVQYAKSLTIGTATYTPPPIGVPLPTPPPPNAIYQEDDAGILKTMFLKKGETTPTDLLGEGFYDNLKFTVTYKKTTKSDILQMDISVSKKNRTEVIYKTSTPIKLYNTGVSINPSTAIEGKYIEFT